MVAPKWQTFAANTTVHGLRYVFESPSRFRRVIWLLLLLGAMGIYVVLVEQSVAKYYSNPVSTEFREIVPEKGELTFPAITICNLNRFVKTKINMFENDDNFYKMSLNLSACEAMKMANIHLSCGQGLLCAFEQFGSAVAENCNETTRQQIISVLNSTKKPIFNPEEFLATYGHDFEDMFLYYCRFAAGENCTPADFKPSLTQNGICFTFNSGENGTNVRGTRKAGSSGGLSVILDVQANENTISEFSRGLRVVVHDQGTFINLEKGFNVFPGSHTLARITATKRERLQYPYHSNCTQKLIPGIPRYSRDGCFLQCEANATLAMCGCRIMAIPVPSNSSVCTFQHQYCEERSAESHNPSKCSCGIPCEEIEYTAQVSYSEFPDVGAAKILKHLKAYNKSMEYQRANLVFLQVGFQHHGYTLVTETPSYRMGSLLGDIGGNMGLFLGCSLLTLFEFVDLLWSVLESRADRSKSISSQEQNDVPV